VGLGWFSRLVREDDAKTFLEFAFRVGIAIRIVDYDLGFWMSVVAATL